MNLSPKGKEKDTSFGAFDNAFKMQIDTSLSDSAIPWVEKYRPQSLADVIHHQDIISTLKRFVQEGKLPHLLLYGPPGTGKTSTAVSLAIDIFGPKKSGFVLELNASDERGIGVVREQIKSFAATKTLSLSTSKGPAFKLIILDECDAMTSAAQNALRRVMEKYIKNVRFILICNYVGQIIPALQSRCTRFRFTPLPLPSLQERLQYVAKSENLTVSPDAEKAIITLASGDMRRIINVLQSCANASATEGHIGVETVYNVTGAPLPADLDRLFRELMTGLEFTSVVSSIKQLQREKGIAIADIIKSLFDRLAEVQVSNPLRIFVTRHLAEIEYHLSQGASDHGQVPAIVGAFFAGRQFLTA